MKKAIVFWGCGYDDPLLKEEANDCLARFNRAGFKVMKMGSFDGDDQQIGYLANCKVPDKLLEIVQESWFKLLWIAGKDFFVGKDWRAVIKEMNQIISKIDYDNGDDDDKITIYTKED